MAGLTAIVLFTRVNKALPTIGDGYDMQAVLAVVVGGTTLAGGKGSVLRTLLGIFADNAVVQLHGSDGCFSIFESHADRRSAHTGDMAR